MSKLSPNAANTPVLLAECEFHDHLCQVLPCAAPGRWSLFFNVIRAMSVMSSIFCCMWFGG